MIFKESDVVELKESVVPNLVKEVVAFANTQGGTIFIGVNDDGKPVGISDIDETILQVKNMIRDAIKPDVTMFIKFDSLTADGKQILSIAIQKGTDKPYYLASKGLKPSGVYVRNGSSSDPSTDTNIRRMIKETDGDSFESMRSLEQQLTFQTASSEFKHRGIEFGEEQKRTLGLINADGIYTNVALLLSDQCLHTIKVATFQGVDQTEFKDRREFGGSLFEQMENVYSYIDFRNQTHSSFDKLRRIDMRDYPETALREAILNALVHRDYSISASTLISIYEDRIEFVSVGGLLPGISQNDIMIGLSVCRNPKLAAIFYRLHLVEAYGTGMQKIINAYKDFSQKPKIKVTDNAFKISLPNINYPTSTGVMEPLESTDSNEATVLSHIQEKGYITRAVTDDLLGVSASTSNRLLRKMVENGVLKTSGNGRQTKYVKK